MSETIFDSEPLSVNRPNCNHKITRTVGFFHSSQTLRASNSTRPVSARVLGAQ